MESIEMQKDTEAQKNSPAKKFRAGGMSATVWQNTKEKEGRKFDVFSVNLERSYKDARGEWKNTNSLRVEDLPKAVLLLGKAFEHLAMAKTEV